MFAEIIFPIPVNKSYYYIIPDELKEKVKFGVRVKADFNNRITIGYVISIKKDLPDESLMEKIKPIISVIDESPILLEHIYKLALWLSDYYITSIGEALKVMVPSALKYKEPKIINEKEEKPNIILTESQEAIYQSIIKFNPGEIGLIFGVTGSGKTEIYFKLIEYFIKKKSKSYTLFLK